MTDQAGDGISLSTLPSDIIRVIIPMGQLTTIEEMCLISQEWNELVQEYYSKRSSRPAICSVCCDAENDDENYGSPKLNLMVGGKYLKYFGVRCLLERHEQREPMDKLNFRVVLPLEVKNSKGVFEPDPRTVRVFERCSSISDFSLFGVTPATVDVIRDCLGTIPVDAFKMKCAQFFDRAFNRYVRKLYLTVRNVDISALCEFIVETMRSSVQSFCLTERLTFPRAVPLTNFGQTREFWDNFVEETNTDFESKRTFTEYYSIINFNKKIIAA